MNRRGRTRFWRLVIQLRLLHLFQALIYLAVIALTRRNSPWGFGIGVIIPVSWNCLNLFVTHNFEAGAEQFWSLVRTGHMSGSETLTLVVMMGRRGSCRAHLRWRRWLPSTTASHEGMGAVLCRRFSGFGLLRSDCRDDSSALAITSSLPKVLFCGLVLAGSNFDWLPFLLRNLLFGERGPSVRAVRFRVPLAVGSLPPCGYPQHPQGRGFARKRVSRQ